MYGYHQRSFSDLGNTVVGHVHYAGEYLVLGQAAPEKVNCRNFLTITLDFEGQHLAHVFDND